MTHFIEMSLRYHDTYTCEHTSCLQKHSLAKVQTKTRVFQVAERRVSYTCPVCLIREEIGGVEGHQGPEVHSQQVVGLVSANERDAYSHLVSDLVLVM